MKLKNDKGKFLSIMTLSGKKRFLNVTNMNYDCHGRSPINFKDRIVVGVDDDELISNKLQTKPGLTLANAVQISRRYEATKQAKNIVRPTTGTVEIVGARHNKPKPKSSQNKPTFKPESKQSRCSRCGGANTHNKSECPANKSKCRYCKKLGHWEKVCRSDQLK